MREIINVCVTLISCTNVFSTNLLDRYQLPLSQRVAKTFPKLKTKFCIIAVPKLGIVLHELNSNQSIRCGNFSKTITGMASLLQSTQTPNVNLFLEQYGRAIPAYTDLSIQTLGIPISLYELCNVFEHEYLYIYRNHDYKRIAKRIKLFMFYSGNNIGCICRYINPCNVIFDIIIYHKYDKNTFVHDIEKIIQWLDKFEIKTIYSPKRMVNISVFYGKLSSICLSLPQEHELLIEKNKQEQIIRTVRYNMRIAAPVSRNTQLGCVFYKYSLFSKPVRSKIYNTVNIDKSNVFKNLIDSIYYIMYNRPWY